LPAGGLAEGKPLSLPLGSDHPLIRAIETAAATGIELQDAALELSSGQAAEQLLVSLLPWGIGQNRPECWWRLAI
jgi:hypothetical protein